MLVSFDWNSFCSPWATLGFLLGAFGAPWAPKGPSLASLWSPFGSLGTPWGHLGHLGLPRGAWDDFGSKMDVQFQANDSQVARLRTKSDLAEFECHERRERRIYPKWRKTRTSQPHFTRAGVQDDVSLEQTPSNYIDNFGTSLWSPVGSR